MKNYLEFEKEIKELEQKVNELKSPFGSEGISEVDTKKIKNTQYEINEKLKETYANLNSWQRTQVARHEDRPKANFYIKKIFSQFTLLSGDRYFGDDKSVTAGFGLIDDKSVLIIECFRSAAILSGSLCAPPNGSEIISSITPSFNKSLAVNFIASAACSDLLGSRQSIEAQPSGDITE